MRSVSMCVLQVVAVHSAVGGGGGGGGGGGDGAQPWAAELLHGLQQLVIMLASVSRRVFIEDAAHADYASHLLRMVAHLTTLAPAGKRTWHVARGTPAGRWSEGQSQGWGQGQVRVARLAGWQTA